MPTSKQATIQGWSHKLLPMYQADAFAVSVPKSGRTWLRFFLQYYFCSRAGVPMSISPAGCHPNIHFTHDLWHHRTTPKLHEQALRLHLIPKHLRRTRKIILLFRDPRDVLVSLHLHLAKRGFKTGIAFTGSLSELVHHRTLGVERMVETQNRWLDEWADSERCLIWRYEHCRENPARSFSEVLRFLDDRTIDENILHESIAFSEFRNMQRMEREHRFDRTMLRPGDIVDPESYKVRRGVIGGYRDYLEAEDARFIEHVAGRLRLNLTTCSEISQAG